MLHRPTTFGVAPTPISSIITIVITLKHLGRETTFLSATARPMAPRRIGPLAQAWHAWKALRLPWRKRFFVGEPRPGLPRPLVIRLRAQAMTSPATRTGSSV